MSNNLISRSALIDVLKKSEDEYRARIAEENLEDDAFSDGILSAMFSVFQMVNGMPTAYDVDKTVERLEKERSRERLNKLRNFLIKEGYGGTQTFNSRNTAGDFMATIYEADGITVDHCSDYEYLEIFGLSDEEYHGLKDILDIWD